MDNFWILYWITRLDSVQTFFGMSVFLSIMTLFVAGSIALLSDNSPFKRWVWIAMFSALFVSSVGAVLTPSKEDAMVIAAGVAVTEVVQSESAKRITSKSVQVIETWLDKQQKDLKKEGK